jgi:hypothetical protein
MVATMSKNRICMEPMRQLNIHPTGFKFFPLRWGVRWCEDGNLFFLCSHYVLVRRFQEDNIGQIILDRVRCYWEQVEEHIGNLGTCLSLNQLGT